MSEKNEKVMTWVVEPERKMETMTRELGKLPWSDISPIMEEGVTRLFQTRNLTPEFASLLHLLPKAEGDAASIRRTVLRGNLRMVEKRAILGLPIDPPYLLDFIPTKHSAKWWENTIKQGNDNSFVVHDYLERVPFDEDTSMGWPSLEPGEVIEFPPDVGFTFSTAEKWWMDETRGRGSFYLRRAAIHLCAREDGDGDVLEAALETYGPTHPLYNDILYAVLRSERGVLKEEEYNDVGLGLLDSDPNWMLAPKDSPMTAFVLGVQQKDLTPNKGTIPYCLSLLREAIKNSSLTTKETILNVFRIRGIILDDDTLFDLHTA